MATARRKIALIGLGDIAQKAYLPIVCCHEEVEPVLCTRSKETLDYLQQKYRVGEAYTSVDELVTAGIDAAMVHSTTESHYAITKQLLEANIPIFVDKPLTYSLEQTKELIALSEQNQTLLYLGFNRRFAPLINGLAKEDLQTIEWNKHRKNLPGEPRTFVLDDFIHVIDSLLFLAPGEIENFQMDHQMNDGLLECISVSWQVGGVTVKGAMNRMHSVTEEFMIANSPTQKWHIQELTSGTLQTQEKITSLNFSNWDSTLYKRGFVNLFEDFLSALKALTFNPQRNRSIADTHELCEFILGKVLEG